MARLERVRLSDWLRAQGLRRFAGAFGDGPVRAAVLAELADADLAALGMGRAERLRFRRAVSERLIAEAATDLEPLEGAPPPVRR